MIIKYRNDLIMEVQNMFSNNNIPEIPYCQFSNALISSSLSVARIDQPMSSKHWHKIKLKTLSISVQRVHEQFQIKLQEITANISLNVRNKRVQPN